MVRPKRSTTINTPRITIKNARVGLGPLREDLIRTYWEWENDPDFLVGFGRRLPLRLEAHTERFEQQARATFPQACFTVYDLEGAEPVPVGVTNYFIDEPVNNAEYTLMLAPGERGRGLATEATTLTLDYAFHVSYLRAVNLKVLEHNTAAIRAYEKAGFRHSGRLRRNGHWYGTVCDELIMDITPEEFTAPSVINTR